MKSKNFYQSFKCALSGIISSFKSERNLKIDIVITLLVILLGFILKISAMEWVAIVLCITTVIGAELLNTAIEHAVDLTTTEITYVAKLAKDAAAGGVLFMGFGAFIVAGIIFIPKFLELF